MLKKSLLLMMLMIGFTSTISADEQEVQNVQKEKEKKKFELPQWVKNIKFSGYAMLQYTGQDPYKVSKDADGNPFLEIWPVSSSTVRSVTSTGAPRFRVPTPLVLVSPPFSSLTSMQNGDDSQSLRSALVSSSVRSPLRTPRTPSHKDGVVMLM